MRIDETIQLVRLAIEEGYILHATAPNGSDNYTAGPYRRALGPSTFALFGYGHSRWLLPEYHGSAWDVADRLVDRVGRGEAVFAVRRAVANAPKFEDLKERALRAAISGRHRVARIVHRSPNPLSSTTRTALLVGAALTAGAGIYILVQGVRAALLQASQTPTPLFTPPLTTQV